MYYLAGGHHLALGYVDHPPLVPALYRVGEALFGHTQLALHVLPAFVGGVYVVVGALLARELGGRRFAQGLTATIAALGALYLDLSSPGANQREPPLSRDGPPARPISWKAHLDIKELGMTRTVIDIDDDKLEAAKRALGTSTKVETVNRALAEVAARKQRLAFLDDLDRAAVDLADPEVMRGAWR
jgi:Arc/MetJ family transcription regulator